MGHEELDIFVRWSRFLTWLLSTTETFPKSVRFTLSSRIDNLALNVLEAIIEAAYSKNKTSMLKRINLDVEKLRVLLCICHDRRLLSSRRYEHAVKELYETGCMAGGWHKQQERP